MGQASSFKTGFCQTRGQDEENDSGGESEIVGEVEGLLGGEEKIRQEVTAMNYPAASCGVSEKTELLAVELCVL